MIASRSNRAWSGCCEAPIPAGLRWTATLLFPPGGPRRFPRQRAPGVLRLTGRTPISRERRGMTAPRSDVANGRREWRDATEGPPDPATGQHRGARVGRRETSRTAATGSDPAARRAAPRRLDDAEPDRSPKAAGMEAPDGARRKNNLRIHRPVETLETDARPAAEPLYPRWRRAGGRTGLHWRRGSGFGRNGSRSCGGHSVQPVPHPLRLTDDPGVGGPWLVRPVGMIAHQEPSSLGVGDDASE